MVVEYYAHNSFSGRGCSLTIYADGSIESTIPDLDTSASGTGEISQEELKRILIEFADSDFFSLDVKDGCVYNFRHPPSKGSEQVRATDATWVRITLTLHGETKSIYY